jgi:hypothetical protein
MPELRGLTGVAGALPCQHVVTIDQTLRRIKKRRAVTAAGPNGAINVWRDDRRRLRSAFCRHRVVIAEAGHSDATSLQAWLAAWWPEMGRE